MRYHQLSQAGAVDTLHGSKIENHFSALLQGFPHCSRNGNRFFPIHHAAPAVNHHHVPRLSAFQTQFQDAFSISAPEGITLTRVDICLNI
jgi:hypothetical protein